MDSVIIPSKAFRPNLCIKLFSSIKYQTLFWLFMIGSVLGFLLEGLWCVIKTGHWEHHVATIWGPFCIIYGIGAVAAFLISQLLSGRHVLLQFGAFFLFRRFGRILFQPFSRGFFRVGFVGLQ